MHLVDSVNLRHVSPCPHVGSVSDLIEANILTIIQDRHLTIVKPKHNLLRVAILRYISSLPRRSPSFLPTRQNASFAASAYTSISLYRLSRSKTSKCETSTMILSVAVARRTKVCSMFVQLHGNKVVR